MTPDEYRVLDAVAIDELVTSGQVTASECATAALAMHERTHLKINAVLEWYQDPTPAVAVRSAEPALRGVPVLRKDYGSAEAGRLVEMGSLLARGNRATKTARLVRLLQGAGAQIVGRSAVPEFIQHGVTESRLHGATQNPYDDRLSAGGSSGGAAAAVAAGVVPLAHASDCAGSIRIPAATCGLVGLKPGRQRVPMERDWNGAAQEFVVCRTVRDARRALGILGVGDYSPAPSKLRCAVSTDHWAEAAIDPEVVAATERVARLLQEQNGDVDAIGPPVDYERLISTWTTSFNQFAHDDAEAMAAVTGRPIDATTVERMTLAAVASVRELSPQDRADGERARSETVAQLQGAMHGYHVLLTPTLGRAVLPLEGLGGNVDPHEYAHRNDEYFPYNYLFNLAGWPSISVPAGADSRGHPIGVQLSTPIGGELLLLDLADTIMQNNPQQRDHTAIQGSWRDRRSGNSKTAFRRGTSWNVDYP